MYSKKLLQFISLYWNSCCELINGSFGRQTWFSSIKPDFWCGEILADWGKTKWFSFEQEIWIFDDAETCNGD